MNIEFFHSVMCGLCFIMSDRIRKIVEEYPKINIIHRSYPLRWDDAEEKKTLIRKRTTKKTSRRNGRLRIELMMTIALT